MDLREMQREVDRWIAPLGYWHPLANLARLTEEVGELAREINHRWGPKTKKPTEDEGDLALEMGDILFVLAVMANQMNVDLSDAIQRVLTKYRERDADRWTRKNSLDAPAADVYTQPGNAAVKGKRLTGRESPEGAAP